MNEEELDIINLEESPKKPPKSKSFWIIFSTMIVVITTLLLICGVVFKYLDDFSRAASVDKKEFINQIKQGILNKNEFSGTNILILGIDKIGDFRGESLLTDTILIGSISDQGSISLTSFPRDLWINPLKTKINALYFYGEKSQDISGIQLASKTMQEISGLDIDNHLILNLDVLRDIIDVAGGIHLEVLEGFIDDRYPRDDIAPDILPIEDRYKTIYFQSGWQDMDGETAIEFIRSRQSTNQDENTDNARSKRQQKVLLSLVEKIQTKEVISSPYVVGNLYKIWKQEIDTSLEISDLISIFKQVVGKEISLQTINIPVQNSDQQGILFNPPIRKYNQWVYEPHDPSWRELHEFLQENLN